MSELAQKKGESAATWVARLGRVSPAGLSDYLLFVLSSWRRDASEKADGAEPDAPARPDESVPTVGKAAGGTAPLEEAKRAVRALSARDLASFTFWLTHGRAG